MSPAHDESSYVEHLAGVESVLHREGREPDVPPPDRSEPGADHTRPSIRVHRWIASG